MARTIYGDREKFMNSYYRPYPGLYFTGDGALRDSDGNYKITGRVDDVINVKGHRIGTAEIESCMVSPTQTPPDFTIRNNIDTRHIWSTGTVSSNLEVP